MAASQAHGKIIDQPDRWPLQPSSQRKLSATKVKKKFYAVKNKVSQISYGTPLHKSVQGLKYARSPDSPQRKLKKNSLII